MVSLGRAQIKRKFDFVPYAQCSGTIDHIERQECDERATNKVEKRHPRCYDAH